MSEDPRALRIGDLKVIYEIMERVKYARDLHREPADRFAVALEEAGELARAYIDLRTFERSVQKGRISDPTMIRFGRTSRLNAMRSKALDFAASAFRILAESKTTTPPNDGLLAGAIALGESARRLLDGPDGTGVDWESGTDIDWDVD